MTAPSSVAENSSQRQRWLATALVDIEQRLRKVVGYRHLPKLREALKAGTEDRGEDINRIEEEGRLNVSRGEFQVNNHRLEGGGFKGLSIGN